ncbi:MAG TPA: WXG100 family type VII secretion target [Anaerolineales bacterium]
MPYIEVEVRRSRTFVPAEAHGIAASWRGIATEVRGVAEALRVLGSALEAGWAGNARDHFLQEFGSMPGEVDGCAELLDSLAGQVESITVTEWETVTERVWQTESVGTKR